MEPNDIITQPSPPRLYLNIYFTKKVPVKFEFLEVYARY